MSLDIRNVNFDDARFLYRIANDMLTRKNSFQSNKIKLLDHITWLKTKLNDNNCFIYIISEDKNRIGYVRIEKSIETVISVGIDKKFRGFGFGSKIIKLACNRYWENANQNDIITAYIKNDNIASIISFKKASFKYKESIYRNGVETVILEAHKNDNKK